MRDGRWGAGLAGPAAKRSRSDSAVASGRPGIRPPAINAQAMLVRLNGLQQLGGSARLIGSAAVVVLGHRVHEVARMAPGPARTSAAVALRNQIEDRLQHLAVEPGPLGGIRGEVLRVKVALLRAVWPETVAAAMQEIQLTHPLLVPLLW